MTDQKFLALDCSYRVATMTVMDTPIEFHLPVRPYSPIDALNRRAAAIGSPRYAMAASGADYNGHHVTLSWNSFRQYYVADNPWASRVVVARGTFAECLRAVLSEYERGALGASASVRPREDDAEAIALCGETPGLVKGSLWIEESPGSHMRKLATGDWYTWRHECATASARDYANSGAALMRFDWGLMQAAADQAEYESALKNKYGSVYGG